MSVLLNDLDDQYDDEDDKRSDSEDWSKEWELNLIDANSSRLVWEVARILAALLAETIFEEKRRIALNTGVRIRRGAFLAIFSTLKALLICHITGCSIWALHMASVLIQKYEISSLSSIAAHTFGRAINASGTRGGASLAFMAYWVACVSVET